MSNLTPVLTRPPKQKRAKRDDPLTFWLLALSGLASLALSGWSLGTLMHDGGNAPWAVAGLAVGVFDVPALIAARQVYRRREAPHTALGAMVVLMSMLTASAVVNGFHGLAMPGHWLTAAVLAAVPLGFEIGFAVKHRPMILMAWFFVKAKDENGQEVNAAWQALRLEVWNRLTPLLTQAQAGSVVLERVPEQVPEPIDWSGTETVPQQVSPVPQVPHLVPSGPGFGTNVAGRTELLRDLIGSGSRSVPELRDQVVAAGFTAPDDSYIRRLIRTQKEI